MLQRPESLQTNTSVSTWRRRWFWITTSTSYWSGSCVRLATNRAGSSWPAPPKAFPRTETRLPGSPTFSSTRLWTLATRKFPAQTSLMFELLKRRNLLFYLVSTAKVYKKLTLLKNSQIERQFLWWSRLIWCHERVLFQRSPQIADRAKDVWCYRPIMCRSMIERRIRYRFVILDMNDFCDIQRCIIFSYNFIFHE